VRSRGGADRDVRRRGRHLLRWREFGGGNTASATSTPFPSGMVSPPNSEAQVASLADAAAAGRPPSGSRRGGRRCSGNPPKIQRRRHGRWRRRGRGRGHSNGARRRGAARDPTADGCSDGGARRRVGGGDDRAGSCPGGQRGRNAVFDAVSTTAPRGADACRCVGGVRLSAAAASHTGGSSIQEPTGRAPPAIPPSRLILCLLLAC